LIFKNFLGKVKLNKIIKMPKVWKKS